MILLENFFCSWGYSRFGSERRRDRLRVGGGREEEAKEDDDIYI